MKSLFTFFIASLFSLNIWANSGDNSKHPVFGGGNQPGDNSNHPVFGGGNQPANCPKGFVAVNSKYCIHLNQNGVATWWDAMAACGNIEAKLCSPSEFTHACMKSAQLGLSGMTDNWEQIDSLTMVTGSNYVRTAVIGGSGTCTIGVSISPAQAARAYRCCYQR